MTLEITLNQGGDTFTSLKILKEPNTETNSTSDVSPNTDYQQQRLGLNARV
jgi:hypothetical protein